jgi:hypothetical protein
MDEQSIELAVNLDSLSRIAKKIGRSLEVALAHLCPGEQERARSAEPLTAGV